MENNLIKRMVLKAVGKAAELEIKKVDSDWQAVCVGLLHQPKRPNNVESLSKKNKK